MVADTIRIPLRKVLAKHPRPAPLLMTQVMAGKIRYYM